MSAPAPGAALPELAEADAHGELGRIYAEIRDSGGVPYVSSMQRHLATRPGWLPWAWAAVRPVFTSGAAQHTAWRLAAAVDAAPLPPLSRSALRVLGVGGGAERTIRAVCESFVRVSPTNLVFSGLVRRLLAGELPGGGAPAADGWMPPAPLPPLPGLVDPAALSDDARAVLAELGTEVGGQPFVPGLYRMLAHWPAYLAHTATVLRPRLADPVTAAVCRTLLERIDGAVPALLAQLPALGATPPAPPRAEHAAVLAALMRYRETSPQMVVFGRLLRDALPT